MSAGYTPGPWQWLTVPHGRNGRYTIASETTRYAVANIVKQGLPSDEANARLIAAAPELLEALQALSKIAAMYHTGEAPGHLDACEAPDVCGHCKAMRKVNAAIARATGEGVVTDA